MTRTRLFGADLSAAQIAQEQLDAAEGDSNTKLPTDGSLVRPQHWTEASSTERPEHTTGWNPPLGHGRSKIILGVR
jgi:hypothetical protein